ncbi:MAG: hypothetical protein ACREPT_10805 [Rudaea sp.]
MQSIYRWSAGIASAVVLLAGFSTSCRAVNPDEAFANDPSITIKYVPGKYYEYLAQLAVKQKNFAKALEMFRKAGYWGNKVSQYNVGMLYLNGADGVPVDKVRGTAWLGIAAQTHEAYVDKALGQAYGGLNADERSSAGAIWKELKVDYGDKVTLDRATKKFNDQLMRDKGTINGPPQYTTITYGNFGGGGGDQQAHPLFNSETGQLDGGSNHAQDTTVNAAKFLAAVKDQFDDFVDIQFGRVSVGEPKSIGDRQKAAANADMKK